MYSISALLGVYVFYGAWRAPLLLCCLSARDLWCHVLCVHLRSPSGRVCGAPACGWGSWRTALRVGAYLPLRTHIAVFRRLVARNWRDVSGATLTRFSRVAPARVSALRRVRCSAPRSVCVISPPVAHGACHFSSVASWLGICGATCVRLCSPSGRPAARPRAGGARSAQRFALAPISLRAHIAFLPSSRGAV